jgi:RsmE family RNA methyltransferase
MGKLIETAKAVKTKILLDIGGEPPVDFTPQYPVMAVVGPPGDLTPEEREQLVQSGFIPIKINEAVLKSETAALAIGAILKFFHSRSAA